MPNDTPISRFLAQRRLAFVGVSRDPKDFSRHVYRAWRERGYEVVPVNPNATDIEGVAAVARIQDVSPPVRAAFLMTPAVATEAVVREAIDAGVTAIWIHRGLGPGAVSPGAVALCREKGVDLVPGECALMHLPHPGAVHRFHGFVRRLTRRLERPSAAA